MVDYDSTTKTIVDSIKHFDRYDTSNITANILSDLVEFAFWAFDCTIFPNLEIIALGDFSHANTCFVMRHRPGLRRFSQGGYPQSLMRSYMSYRDSDSAPIIPFEIVRPLDVRHWDGLDACREMVTMNGPGDPWDGNT
jgi:hypothetical protein